MPSLGFRTAVVNLVGFEFDGLALRRLPLFDQPLPEYMLHGLRLAHLHSSAGDLEGDLQVLWDAPPHLSNHLLAQSKFSREFTSRNRRNRSIMLWVSSSPSNTST